MPRTPKPTMLHLVQNTFNSTVHGGARFQPIPEGTLGQPPDDWTAKDIQRKEWEYVLSHAPIGMLRSLDRRLLICWCECCADYDRAREQVQQFGAVIKTPNGFYATSPFVTQRDRAAKQMRMLAEQLGFSPAGRTRLQVHEQQTDGDWARLKVAASGVKEPPAG